LNGAAKARNYHAQLQAMLQGLQRVQTGVDSRLQNVEIYCFEKCLRVDVLCPIQFIGANIPALLTNYACIFQVMVKGLSV
jgi:hypothetical protein